MAAATLLNPAILLPATKLGNSPSFGSTYFFAVSSPFLKHSAMIPFNFSSTSSLVHLILCEFCAISSPETATPPAFAALPGAYQIASPLFVFLFASKMSIASCVQPMLLPSAMNLALALIRPSASSPETSFCVAHGSATSTSPTCNHGRAPPIYLKPLSLSATSESCFLSTLSWAIVLISSGVTPFSSVATMAPLLSLRETTVAPSSIHLRAAYCATLPEPEMTTFLPLKDSLPPDA